MKTRSGLSLFFVVTIAALAVLTCSDRSPVSPGSNGLLTLDLRLSKVSEQTIDKVIVEAKNPPMEPVRGKLTVTGKTATGSLEVLPGKWLVVVEAFSGNTLCYHGEIGLVDVVAGKSTTTQPITLEATRDLVTEEIYIRWSDTKARVNPKDLVAGDVVDLVLSYRNAGSVDASGWRFEAYLDEGLLCSLNDVEIPAGEEWLLWCRDWTATVGTHTIEFRLDTENVIGENDETNNTVSLTFTIPPPIDLVAEETYITRAGENTPIDPHSLVEGDEVDLVLSYRNAGSVDASGWRFEAYLDEVLLCSLNDVTILAGKERLLWCPNWTATEGTHTVEFRLDTDDVVKELDETNNILSLTFTVQRGGIIAGQSVDGVELGFTKIQVIEALREPPDRDAPVWTFDDLGIEVEFDAMIPARVSWIMVFAPYSGTTERGIGLGATDSEVEAVYGIDYMWFEDGFGNYTYEYMSLGIMFEFDSSDMCVDIGIYSP